MSNALPKAANWEPAYQRHIVYLGKKIQTCMLIFIERGDCSWNVLVFVLMGPSLFSFIGIGFILVNGFPKGLG